jgi:glycosyltransferase involved in cell wall biosynthesis
MDADKREKTMKLSVFMLAYNQADYIERALNSALMQDTNFPYEIVVGEDCSTDGTREIVERYQREYPDKIKALLRPQNIGMHANIRETMAACQGEYIAFLEGDDYWLSAAKLQKQVDFLDAHPECVLCFHPVLVMDTIMGEEYEYGPTTQRLMHDRMERKESYDLFDALQEPFVTTCSVVARNHVLDGFPKWVTQLAMSDWPVNVLYAAHGRLGCIHETMAAYLRHPGGAWSKLTRKEQFEQTAAMYKHLDKHFEYKHSTLIRVLTNAQRIGKLLEEFGDEMGRLHAKIADLGQLAEERPGLYGRIQQLADDLAAEQRRAAALGEELAALHQERQQLHNERLAIHQQLPQLAASLAAEQQRAAAQGEELRTLHSERQQLHQRIQELGEQLGAEQQRAAEQGEELRTLHSERQPLHARIQQLADELAAEQRRAELAALSEVQVPVPQAAASNGNGATSETSEVIKRIRELVPQRLPQEAIVLAVSKGDSQFTDLNGRRVWHFPRSKDAGYAGYYPASGADAVAHLQAMQEEGGTHLLLPQPAFWWLDHYAEFAEYLRQHGDLVVDDDASCKLFALHPTAAA